MKVLFLFIIIPFFLCAHAGAQLLSPQFSYEYTERSNIGFNLELHQMTQHFEEQHFSRFTPFSSGTIPGVHADEILNSTQDAGVIFIKMGLLAPSNLHGKIIELKSNNSSFFLYHTKETSIAFFNMNEHKVKKLIQGLEFEVVSFSTISQFFISSAHADQVVCNKTINNSFNDMQATSLGLENSFLIKKIGECAVTALKSAGTQAEDTINFFKKLASNPTALWEDVKKSYEGLKSFVTNFSHEIQSIYQTMSGLTMDEKLEIACTLTGQVGVGLAMVLTGTGAVAGGAKIISSITPKLIRMKNLMQQFQRFKIPYQSAKETLSCAI
jgi:hypothetical protein